ncbi:MAG TPA: hypothetical protein VGR43_09465, partial [Dehalococcoidia bacterium]|nr:hypothetical protein [Dehalococcoidia bacterium]
MRVRPAPPDNTSQTLPLAPLRTVSITTDEGTWMSLDVAPDGKTIAFELLGNLFTVPITGGHARQLTEGPAWHERPRYALDGRSLFFTSDRGGYNQLWQMPITGGTPTRVPGDTLTGYRLAPEVDFSPELDSAELGVVYRAAGGRYEIRHRSTKSNGADLYSVCEGREFVLTDRETGTERVLAQGGDCGGDRLPSSAFTPDGRAFITAFGGKLRRIAVPSGETTVIPFRAIVRLRMRPLTRFPVRVSEDSLVHARRLAGATLSPDGLRLAFSAFSRIWVASVADRVPKPLTNMNIGQFWPAWSPDGQYIAFLTWTDDRGGDGAIYRTRADGSGAPERLTHESGAYTGLAYSIDGTLVYAIRRSPEAMRRYGDYSDLTGTAETVAIPATGGVVRNWSNGFWKGETTLAGLHVLPGEREQIARFVSRGVAGADGKQREAGAVIVSARGAP